MTAHIRRWTHLALAAVLATSGALTAASAALPSSDNNPPGARVACDPALMAGTWGNAAKEYKGAGVYLRVEAVSGQAVGKFNSKVKPNGVWPVPMLRSISINEVAATAVVPPGGQCLFKSSCQEITGAPKTCWVQYDPAADSLKISYSLGAKGIADARESAPWTRPQASGSPAAAARAAPLACTAPDIEGLWNRPDGSGLVIADTTAAAGGRGGYLWNPRGWQRGVDRYTAIRKTDGCTWTAVCTEISRVGGDTGDVRRTDVACALTVDPAKRTLTPTTGAAWRREAYDSPEAEARRKIETELAEQDAVSESLNAEVNGRNAEAEARDRAKDAEYQRQQRAYEARKKADAEAYARAQAEYERKKAEVEAKRKADLEAWQRAVEACKAGDKTACAPK